MRNAKRELHIISNRLISTWILLLLLVFLFLDLEQQSLGIKLFDSWLISLAVGEFAASPSNDPNTACAWDWLKRVWAASSVAMSAVHCI